MMCYWISQDKGDKISGPFSEVIFSVGLEEQIVYQAEKNSQQREQCKTTKEDVIFRELLSSLCMERQAKWQKRNQKHKLSEIVKDFYFYQTQIMQSLKDSITYTESSMEAKSPFSSTQSKELSQNTNKKNASLNMETQNKWLVVAVVLNGEFLLLEWVLAVSYYGKLIRH